MFPSEYVVNDIRYKEGNGWEIVHSIFKASIGSSEHQRSDPILFVDC